VAAAGSRVPSASPRCRASQVDKSKVQTTSSCSVAAASQVSESKQIEHPGQKTKTIPSIVGSLAVQIWRRDPIVDRGAAGRSKHWLQRIAIGRLRGGISQSSSQRGEIGQPTARPGHSEEWCCAQWQQPCHEKTKGEPQGPPGFDDRANGSPPWPSNMFR